MSTLGLGSPGAAAIQSLDEMAALCVELCLECSAVCTNCAEALIRRDGERAASIPTIRINWNCADLCLSTARILSKRHERDSVVIRAALEACIAACLGCADDCDRHAETLLNAAAAAKTTRRCASACRKLLDRM